ncbi:unnamed protein product, partial [Meganyctiphanes norvegica]
MTYRTYVLDHRGKGGIGIDGGIYSQRDGDVRSGEVQESMLDLLERMATYRLDDQRCSLPPNMAPHHLTGGMRDGPGKPPPDKDEAPSKSSSRARLQEALQKEPPFAQVELPDTGYWDETNTAEHNTENYNSNNKFETDEVARYYRRYFMGKV